MSDLKFYSSSTDELVIAALATDVCCLVGSTTKLIYVTRVLLSGSANVSTASAHVDLFKRTSPNSGGTFTYKSVVSFDTFNTAPTAVVKAYTANPTTLGKSAGIVVSVQIGFATTNDIPSSFEHIFCGQGLVLRGEQESLCVNLDGVTVSGGKLDITFFWNEQ